MKQFLSNTVLAAALAVSGMTAAQAATVSVEFNFEGLSGQIAPNLNSVDSVSGLTLAVTPHTFEDISTIGGTGTLTASSPDVAVGINTNGIGVCEPNRAGTNCTGGDELDGGSASGRDNELLLFAFDRIVSAITVVWSNNDTNDDVSLFESALLTFAGTFTAIAPPDRSQVVPISGPLSVFGLGMQGDSDQLRIAGLKVSYTVPDEPPPVPLPAAGWMLIAGIGGLAALRRRKRA